MTHDSQTTGLTISECPPADPLAVIEAKLDRIDRALALINGQLLLLVDDIKEDRSIILDAITNNDDDDN